MIRRPANTDPHPHYWPIRALASNALQLDPRDANFINSVSPASAPIRSAGTWPADDTRSASSNLADMALGVWESCTYEMPFVRRRLMF
jgi:hypothetical protein